MTMNIIEAQAIEAHKTLERAASLVAMYEPDLQPSPSLPTTAP